MEKLLYSNLKHEKIPLTEKEDLKLWNEAMLLRSKVVDKISEYNEVLAEKIINEESMDNIKTTDIVKALREETFNQVIK